MIADESFIKYKAIKKAMDVRVLTEFGLSKPKSFV